MTAAMQLWKNFFLVGYYNHRAVAPCLLQKHRTPEQAVEAAERYIIDTSRKHYSTASVYGVYVSACPAQWQKVGVVWESVLGPPLYSDMDRLALGASNFLWTHVAERRGFNEVECYSREQKGENIRPPLLFPHRLMRVLHVQWKSGNNHSTLWSPAVEAIASRPTKSKRLRLARDAFVELVDMCNERNAFNLSFRHGA